MNFGEAIACLKKGGKVHRTGWNGRGMFLYYVPKATYPAHTAAARGHFGDRVPYRDYIAMKTVQDDAVPWVASQTDILANDWEELPA